MREFLSGAAYFLAFLTVIGMIVGLIYPEKLAEKGQAILPRKDIFLSFVIVAFVLTGIGYAVSPSDVKSTASLQDSDAIKTPEQQADINTKGSASSKAEPVFLNVSMTDSERKFLQDAVCIDEKACYGNKSFEQDIYKEFPDLKVMHPRIKEASRVDSAGFKNQYHEILRGLYFAKKMKLANGQSLYDFLTQCSGPWDINNRAEFDLDSKKNQSYFYLQYFPKLRKSIDGQPIELNLIFDRRGETIVPNSMAFSTHVLNSRDFLNKHGLKCWNE